MARRVAPSQLIGSGLIPEQFQKEYAGYENDYQGALSGLQRDERNLFADYGFQGGVGAGGEVNFQADPNANHGLYQQLLQNIGGQLGQAKQEVRGRGLGRAGLAKARENLIRFMMSGEKSNLLSNFNKGAAGIFGARGDALTARNRGFNTVEGNALDWWNQYGPEDPDGTLPEPGSGTNDQQMPAFSSSMIPNFDQMNEGYAASPSRPTYQQPIGPVGYEEYDGQLAADPYQSLVRKRASGGLQAKTL